MEKVTYMYLMYSFSFSMTVLQSQQDLMKYLPHKGILYVGPRGAQTQSNTQQGHQYKVPYSGKFSAVFHMQIKALGGCGFLALKRKY